MPYSHTKATSTLVQVLASCRAVRQHLITYDNVDPDICRHMVTPAKNGRIFLFITNAIVYRAMYVNSYITYKS